MLLNPLRRYLDRLLYKFGYIRISQPMLPIGDDLVPLLRELAGPGQTDVEDVAQDLLLYAIDKRNADMASLRLWESLTAREQQTAALVCLGYTNHEIAGRMVISVNTVKTHLRNIFGKFGISSKTELQDILSGWDFGAWVEDESGIHPLVSPQEANL